MTIIEKLSEYFPVDIAMKNFLLDHTEYISVRKNETISRQDSYNWNVYFVEKGLLRSFYVEKGKDVVTNFYPEGKLAANIDTLFNHQPTRYSIEAIEDSELLYCDYRKLETFCDGSISAANFSRFILGKLMTQMASRTASLQYMNARERYEQLMAESPDIILRAPLGMIAGYLGMTQETLSRIRAKG